jgi:hypothetical protein
MCRGFHENDPENRCLGGMFFVFRTRLQSDSPASGAAIRNRALRQNIRVHSAGPPSSHPHKRNQPLFKTIFQQPLNKTHMLSSNSVAYHLYDRSGRV